MKDLETLISTIVDSLGAHPIVGTCISLISASFGMLLNTTGYIDSGVPNGIKDIFQMIAWVCTITVSMLTVIGFVRKELKESKTRKRGKTKNNSKEVS